MLPLVVAAFVAGAGMEVFSTGWSVSMQEHIDERVLSRAYSYDALGSFVAMPLGQILYGPLGDAFGYRPVLMTTRRRSPGARRAPAVRIDRDLGGGRDPAALLDTAGDAEAAWPSVGRRPAQST